MLTIIVKSVGEGVALFVSSSLWDLAESMAADGIDVGLNIYPSTDLAMENHHFSHGK